MLGLAIAAQTLEQTHSKKKSKLHTTCLDDKHFKASAGILPCRRAQTCKEVARFALWTELVYAQGKLRWRLFNDGSFTQRLSRDSFVRFRAWSARELKEWFTINCQGSMLPGHIRKLNETFFGCMLRDCGAARAGEFSLWVEFWGKPSTSTYHSMLQKHLFKFVFTPS